MRKQSNVRRPGLPDHRSPAGARRTMSAARQRRYVISMSVRTVSVILAAVLWNVERHVALVALVLGMVLPYIAVVIANAGRENAPCSPRPS